MRLSRTICLLALVCIVPGCQGSYKYVISGTVRDASTGKPVAGVQVDLDATHTRPFPVTTAADGTFSVNYEVPDNIFSSRLPTWFLKLSKTGFDAEKINISPTHEPESWQTGEKIVVVVYLRPSK